jgi:nitroimidazol reductase NimA-like FMN-containing flavoprotein (pyridoxamine 5'-phosphate oxidase superfamily)
VRIPAQRQEVSDVLIHELTDEECAAVLERTSLGRLGYTEGTQPFIVPTFFAFDREANRVFAFSHVGRKIEAMRVNPRVCLEVEDIHDNGRWTTVLAIGRFREIGRDERDLDTRLHAERLLQRRPEWWLPGAARVASREHDRTLVYEISINRLSGRRAARERAFDDDWIATA